MRPPERGLFRDRLYLLDENREWIAGAGGAPFPEGTILAVESGGRIVGWIGFSPLGNALPPDAQQFLAGQIRITAVSFLFALAFAAGLAYLLARKVSRPVRQLGETVRSLSQGDYQARVPFDSPDELGTLAGYVNQLAGALEKNRTARRRWIADIAHELRTPVAILKGEAEALADGIRPADERMKASLQEEIDLLSNLVDDLQTLAMSDAGALNIRKDRTDLSSLVRQSVEMFRDRLDERGISIELRVADAIDVVADQSRLRQLLLNLLENCCRYVEPDGRVRLTLSRDHRRVKLVLEDSGPGLDPEQMGKLFDRFYRVEGGRSRSGGGSGLGLSICKNIVEAHGGDIHAERSGLGGLQISASLPAG